MKRFETSLVSSESGKGARSGRRERKEHRSRSRSRSNANLDRSRSIRNSRKHSLSSPSAHLRGDEIERRAHGGLRLLHREPRGVGGGGGDVLQGGARHDPGLHGFAAAGGRGRTSSGAAPQEGPAGARGRRRRQQRGSEEALHAERRRTEEAKRETERWSTKERKKQRKKERKKEKTRENKCASRLISKNRATRHIEGFFYSPSISPASPSKHDKAHGELCSPLYIIGPSHSLSSSAEQAGKKKPERNESVDSFPSSSSNIRRKKR